MASAPLTSALERLPQPPGPTVGLLVGAGVNKHANKFACQQTNHLA